MLKTTAGDETLERKLAVMFPEDDPGVEPTGVLLIVQERSEEEVTDWGFIIGKETRDYAQAATAVGKVVAMGELCFHDIETGKPWAGGAWCRVGDYILMPKLCDTKWRPTRNGVESKAIYRTVKDKQVIGVIRDLRIIPELELRMA